MTTFTDGPAQGQHLMLHRAARFLRVVRSKAGQWDGLDQLTDTPTADETLYVYELLRHLGNCHVRAAKGRGGFYPVVEYSLCPEQPDDTVMRDAARWAAWCQERAAL